MTGNVKIDDLLRAVGARLRRRQGLEILSVALIASLAVVAFLALVGRVAGEPVLAVAAAAGVLACAGCTAALAWWRGRVGALDAAVYVDAAAQLHERVSTLLCAQGAGLRTRAAEALLDDVNARADSLEPSRLAPVRWPGRTRFAAIPAALALALALAPISLGPGPHAESAGTPAAVVLAGEAAGAAGAAGEKGDAVRKTGQRVVVVFQGPAPDGAKARALAELAKALEGMDNDEVRRVQAKVDDLIAKLGGGEGGEDGSGSGAPSVGDSGQGEKMGDSALPSLGAVRSITDTGLYIQRFPAKYAPILRRYFAVEEKKGRP